MPNYYHIKHRRDTAANWASRNPTPADGEVCIETDTKRKKVGDGVTPYNSLTYDLPGNATQSAAGLMSAADKQKLDGINLSLYAKLQSPEFTGTPLAPTGTSFNPTKQIANLAFVLNTLAKSVLQTLAVRVTFSLSTTTVQTVINDNGFASCLFMAVNDKAVNLEKTQKLMAGLNTIDFIFTANSNFLIDIPGASFKGIANIVDAVLPERAKSLGANCFENTTLKNLYSLSPTPPSLGSAALTGTPVAGGTGYAWCYKAFASYYQTDWSTIPNLQTI